MSAKSYGTAFLFGVSGTVANCAVQSWKNASTTANQATVESEYGNVIEHRKDDIHDEGTIELKYRAAFAVPTAKDTIAWQGFTWMIDKVNRSEANKTHRVVSLDLKKTEYVNATTATDIPTDTVPV